MKTIKFTALILALALTLTTPAALADSAAIDFESYSIGTVHGQDGWGMTGSYDVAVATNSYGYGSFGGKSLRISNAVTSSSFGDHTFSKPLVDEAGETAAYVDVPSGTRQAYFMSQWDFASTVPGSEQAGLSVVASPDRGDGGRMSWVQMKDTPSGLEVNFFDYQDAAPYGSVSIPTDGYGPEDAFIFTNLVSGLDRTVPHTIRIELELIDGPRNDVVRVYVDGLLMHTGTSWEDYFRWVQGLGGPEETAPVHESRVIRSMLFRTGGAAMPATMGNGFLIDNLSLFSGPLPVLPPQCTTVCYVDEVSGDDANGGASAGNAKKTIQAAIDAVDPGGQVRVLPGNYSETAVNRWVLGTNGPHQFGLFIDKDGITIQGVDAGDVPITDYNLPGAYVTTNATNNFGASGIFVEGDNVTIAGLRIGPNTPGDNKTIEIIGDGFTLKDSHVDVPGGGSVYFNDWQFDTGTDTSHVQSYTIDHNLIDQSTSIDITSGAGYSGPVSGRQIVNNEFENSEFWPSISFNGSGTGVPWFVQSVGGAVIENNAFTNTFDGNDVRAGHIRIRGDYDNSQFDWTAYWNNNTFNKAVVILTGAYPPFDVREYNYTSGAYSFDVRRIGVNIQGSVDKAVASDTVLVKAGTYVEQVAVDKSLTLLGESGAASTFIVAPSTIPIASDPNSTIVKIAGSGVSVDFSGFTVTGPGPSGCGSIGSGIFVRDDAYANIHDNEILDIRDNPFSGCQNGVAILVGRAAFSTSGSADISNNVIAGYQKNGVTVSNVGSSATVANNVITGAGATTIIAQNGVQFSGGATGDINGNTISNHSYSPGSYTSTGILLYVADANTYGNTMSENQSGIYHIEGSGVHEANIMNVSTAGTLSPYFYGFVVDAPPPGLNPVPFEDESLAPSAAASANSLMSFVAVQDVDILNNELTGDGTSAGYGIGAYGGFGALDIDLTVKNNKALNFGIGLDIYQCTGSCSSGVFSNIDVNLNSITGSVDYGLLNTDAIQVNAEKNWWGNASGPSHASNPAGIGDVVSDNVDFDPWLCNGIDTSPATGFQPNIVTLCGNPAPAACLAYGVQDTGYRDSQFFTLDPSTAITANLGPLYLGWDVEGLDIDPTTGVIYAATGPSNAFGKRGHLFKVDGTDGSLFHVGATGQRAIVALAFRPTDGTLWGWGVDKGLVTINKTSGAATLIKKNDKDVEGMAWNNTGTLLYLAQGRTLYVYNPANGKITKVADKLPGYVEALEMRPDGLLVLGVHGKTTLFAYNPLTKKVITAENIAGLPYNDIEGISWPVCIP